MTSARQTAHLGPRLTARSPRAGVRDALQARLTEAGIGALIDCPIQPHMRAVYTVFGIAQQAVAGAQGLAQQGLSLPMGPYLDMGHMSLLAEEITRAT